MMISPVDPPVDGRVVDIDFGDAVFLQDPYPELLRLQKEDPVYWSKKQQGWIVTRHQDVKSAYSDRRLSSQRQGQQLFSLFSDDVNARLGTAIKFTTSIVNSLDGEQHLRVRTPMQKAFRPPNVHAMRGFVQDVVDEILNDLQNEHGEFNFHQRVSAVIPTKVIQRMLGVPEIHGHRLFQLAEAFTAALGAAEPTAELFIALDVAIGELNEIFLPLIHERKDNPGVDVISSLIHAGEGADRLTDDELLSCCHALVVAGVETTAHTMGTGLVEIIRCPELRDRVTSGPDDAMAVVMELLRYPGTVKCMTRIALEDFEWHGKEIRAGDLVWMMNAAANVDPSVFVDGCRVDPDRDNKPSMAFGPGLHFCIGHLLSRIELAEFFSRAFKRFEIELTSTDLLYKPSYIFRGYESLMVRCKPRI
jgi:cytochrome P450 PksS